MTNTTKDDGGPAFPTELSIGPGWDQAAQMNVEQFRPYTGMTLRDYFAAKAMAAFCSVVRPGEATDEIVASWAYHTADAMLAARSA